MRRDVGSHADRDPGGSVDQQVRERSRENGGFFGRLVEVRNEVDRLLLEIGHQFFGERLEPGFGVSIRRRRIAIDRSEVPLAVHQGIAHVEILGEPHQRVVCGGVAVRVIVADDLADDFRALAVGAIRRESHLPHRVQDAAMGGLQSIAYVGQRSSDDYAHRVIHVRALHLVFDVDGDAVGCIHEDDSGRKQESGIRAQPE